MTPGLGRNLREIGDALAGGRGGARFVALTHAHGDHCFGAGELGGAAVIATSWTRDALADRWQQQVAHLTELRPHLAAEFASAERVLPHVLVGRSATLDLGGVEVELRAVGPAHTPGDLAIIVDADGVAFVGDNVFNGHWPMLYDADPDGWLELLGGDVLRRETIVPGHGPVGGSELLDRMAECLRLLLSAAEDREPTPLPEGLASWLHSERLEPALEHLRASREARVAANRQEVRS